MENIEYEHEEGEELDLAKKQQIKKAVLMQHLENDVYWIKLRKQLIARKYGKGYKPNKQTFEIQRQAFEVIVKRHYPKLKNDWKDEFTLFWIGFLKGEYKSINQYLKRKNYA